jgi:hypothetical protein
MIEVEKFTEGDIGRLREELQQSGLDRWQQAELLNAFLITRGYGVSLQKTISEISGCNFTILPNKKLQQILEGLALVA